MVIFEVRLPCYERPQMLRRALQSLQSQSYPHWQATVYDDSQTDLVREIVTSLSDVRVTYVRNSVRRGAALNIDQCFSPASQSGGHYGCILEDDNYWLPQFLELVEKSIRDGSWDLILANQRVHDHDKGLLPQDTTTRGDWLHAGAVQPIDLRALLFYMEGLSNGGLVWRLEGPDLRVGPAVRETGLHEACRSLLVRRSFLFIDEAQAVWSSMPKASTARNTESNRTISRGMQSIRSLLLTTHGHTIVERAKLVAVNPNRVAQLVQSLAHSGRPQWADPYFDTHKTEAGYYMMKGLLLRTVKANPCAAFLKRLGVDGLTAESAHGQEALP